MCRFVRALIAAAMLLACTPAWATGTLYGLGLSQQLDNNGKPLVGALLYIYTAGTLNPARVFSDYSLTIPHTFPIVADAHGRIPAFWMADGSYRVRLTDQFGNVQFDEDNLQSVGNVGGGGNVVDPTTIAATGDQKCRPLTGVLSGWVRENGRTIGSATSGATERANSDTQALYTAIWNGCADSQCPVTGGRGASASADFSNNKPISLPDARSRAIVGLDDMGNSAAGRITGNTTVASGGGAQSYTIAQANLPAVALNLTASGSTGSFVDGVSANTGSNYAGGGSKNPVESISVSAGPRTVNSTGTTDPLGSGAALTTLSPYLAVTCYLKL